MLARFGIRRSVGFAPAPAYKVILDTDHLVDPWQTVARLKVPKQDSFNYALKCFWEDRLRVDPWMGLKSLEPLGGPNRLRKVVYPASSALRRKMNATTELHIKSMDELPVH
jgi:hypothetical protein